MFSKAISDATEYTKPVTTLVRLNSGEVITSVATYIHLDDLGHALTARHIHVLEDCKDRSFLFNRQHFQIELIADDEPNDLILVKLKDYTPGSIKNFPKFLKSSYGTLSQRAPLVRLGFPRSVVNANCDEIKKGFNLISEKYEFFHNEGFFIQYEIDDKRGVHHLEMSTPALIGQSGGPVLTANGIVSGLQSKNSVFELDNNKTIEVGMAASHLAIARMLENNSTVRTNWL